MSTTYGQVVDNRTKASNSMNYGVGKINAIIRDNRYPTQDAKIKDIVRVVKYAIKTNNPDLENIFYAGVEAIKGESRKDSAGYIIDLFDELKKHQKEMSEATGKEYEIAVLDSEKMNGILFEAYVKKGDYPKAAGLLDKLQANSANSTSFIEFHSFIVGEVSDFFGFRDEMSPEEISRYEGQVKNHISNSVEFLEKKFYDTYDFQTGTELLRFKLTMNENMEDIRKLADLVFLSSKKFNVEEMTNESKVLDYVFVLKLAGNPKAKKILSEIRLSKSAQLEVNGDNGIIRNSKAYKNLSGKEREDFERELNMKFLEPLPKPPAKDAKGNWINYSNAEPTAKEKADAIIAGSYSYAGTLGNIEEATYVGGNLGYSGQVPDHCITKKDVQLFDAFMKVKIFKLFPMKDGGSPNNSADRIIPENVPENVLDKTLAELDFEKEMPIFMAVVDGMIRGRFTTTDFAGQGLNMEHQALLKESVYNDAFKSILAECGAFGLNVDGNSLTNIATLFMEGLGDCRHHAQIKQIMFDRWKDTKMNEAIAASQEGSETSRQKAMEQIDFMSRTELRTFDVRISTNLQMEQAVGYNGRSGQMETWDSMYRPEWVDVKDEQGNTVTDDKGNPKKGLAIREDGKTSCLEEHTMCMLVTRNEQGELTDLRFADAFYQATNLGSDYNLGYGAQSALGREINLTGLVRIGQSGKFEFNADGVFNEGNIAQRNGQRGVSVLFEPTAYAGKRDHELYGRFEHSQLCGVKYDAPENVEDMLEHTLGKIESTFENHQDRIKSAEAYSHIRRCIVRNLIAKNLRESGTLDISSDIRDSVETSCKTKKVSEMDEAETKRLNSVCNDLSEMRSPKFCEIYYAVASELQKKEIAGEFDGKESDDINRIIEDVCNSCSEEYFKRNNLDNAQNNRKNEIAFRLGQIKKASEQVTAGKMSQADYMKMTEDYLKLSFPVSMVEQFMEGAILGNGEFNIETLFSNMEKMSTLETPENVSEQQIEVNSQKVTVQDVRANPERITEVSTEDFAQNQAGYLNAIREAVFEIEQKIAEAKKEGREIDLKLPDFELLESNIGAKVKEIREAVLIAEAEKAAEAAQQAGIDAENARRENETALGVGV